MRISSYYNNYNKHVASFHSPGWALPRLAMFPLIWLLLTLQSSLRHLIIEPASRPVKASKNKWPFIEFPSHNYKAYGMYLERNKNVFVLVVYFQSDFAAACCS